MLRPGNLVRLLLAICFALACQAQQRTVAVTFDDLPAAGTMDAGEAASFNQAILDSLDRHHVPAIGFVIEDRVVETGKSGTDSLREWVRRGYGLGNHTLSHSDFNNLTVDQFKQEIVGGERSITVALGKHPRYFRFPDNHTGDTREKHDAIAEFLASRGYTVAVCTIDNEDYLFNRAYTKMLANKDEASASRLRSEYLTYTATEIDYYSNLHRQLFASQGKLEVSPKFQQFRETFKTTREDRKL
jgi:peptidoglycan/xylan/chitin deacetylase (PgdA/CDA1 family)